MNNLHGHGDKLQEIFYAVNRQGKDKLWDYEKLTVGFEDTTGTLEDLKREISEGYAINGAHFGGDRRRAANVKKVGLLLLDIDDGLTIEDALANPFIQKYCGLAYTTASHTPNHHKFRLVFPLPKPMSREDFETLVKLLSGNLPNDPSCKDAGRVFYGNSQADFFLFNPDAVLPEDWIDQAIADAKAERLAREKEWQKRREWRKKNQVFTTDSIPLLTCCSRDVRDLVKHGTPTGSGHNEDALKVLAELIGVENYLREIGQPVSDTASDNYAVFLQSSGVNDHKAQDRWEWAEGRNYLPSLSPDKIDTCIKSWKYRQLAPAEQKTFREKYKFDPPKEPPKLTYEEEIKELVTRNLAPSKLTTFIQAIAKRHKVYPAETRKLYDQIQAEDHGEEARSEVAKDLRQLISTQSEKIDLDEILPERLAEAITRMAGWLNLRPEGYLTALLCGTSSVISPETKLTLSRATNHRVNAGLYGGIVANSSQKKSPIISEMITKPLIALQEKDEAAYQAKLAEHKAQTARYKKLEKSKNPEDAEALATEFPNGEPEAPTQTVRFYTDVTGEKLKAQIAAQPDQGVMKLSDELAAVFKNANAYRNGKGSDIEDLLTLYDGQGFVIGRKSEGNVFVKQANVGLFGGIQPKVLEQLFGDGLDSNGNWARFIFCQQPLAASTPPEHDEGGVNLEEMMIGLYQAIADTPSQTFYLSKEAYQYYRRQVSYFDAERIKLGDLPLSNQYGKAAGRIGKLALTLHHIQAAFEGVQPTQEVSVETLVAAVVLTAFYISQVASLYAAMDKDDQLAPHLLKIIDLAKRRNEPITPRLAAKFIRGLKSDQAREYLQELSALGYGTIQQGKTLKFTLSDPSADKCRQNTPTADKVPTIVGTLKPSNSKGFISSADSADSFSTSPKLSSIPTETDLQTGYNPPEKNISSDNLSALSALPTEPLPDKALDVPTPVGTTSAPRRHLDPNVGTSATPTDKLLTDPLPGDRESLTRLNDSQIKELGMNATLAKLQIEELLPGKESRENLDDMELYHWVSYCQRLIEERRRA